MVSGMAVPCTDSDWMRPRRNAAMPAMPTMPPHAARSYTLYHVPNPFTAAAVFHTYLPVRAWPIISNESPIYIYIYIYTCLFVAGIVASYQIYIYIYHLN